MGRRCQPATSLGRARLPAVQPRCFGCWAWLPSAPHRTATSLPFLQDYDTDMSDGSQPSQPEGSPFASDSDDDDGGARGSQSRWGAACARTQLGAGPHGHAACASVAGSHPERHAAGRCCWIPACLGVRCLHPHGPRPSRCPPPVTPPSLLCLCHTSSAAAATRTTGLRSVACRRGGQTSSGGCTRSWTSRACAACRCCCRRG